MLLASYPYLGMSLALLLLLLGGLLVRPEARRLALLSGLLQAPLGFLSVFFVPDYWAPARLFAFGAGPEDLLFSFSAGGLVWFIASSSSSHRLEVEIAAGRILRRYAAFALPGVAAGALLWWSGVGPMHATFAVGAVAVAILARRQRWALPLSAAGAVGFALLYAAVLKGAYLLWPAFPEQWSTAGAWGLSVWGLPLEEIVWAAGGGAAWPLFMAELTGARRV